MRDHHDTMLLSTSLFKWNGFSRPSSSVIRYDRKVPIPTQVPIPWNWYSCLWRQLPISVRWGSIIVFDSRTSKVIDNHLWEQYECSNCIYGLKLISQLHWVNQARSLRLCRRFFVSFWLKFAKCSNSVTKIFTLVKFFTFVQPKSGARM